MHANVSSRERKYRMHAGELSQIYFAFIYISLSFTFLKFNSLLTRTTLEVPWTRHFTSLLN